MSIFPVILSGGSGTRLWPLSREQFPKQFIALVDGTSGSLLGETLKRLDGEAGYEPPTLLCNNGHRFLVADELDRAGIAARAILLEPVARNTAPAITLAALSALKSDPDAILVVMPSDHAIPDVQAFRAAVRNACAVAARRKLVLFGIPPVRPHTGYGYIRRGAPLTGGADAACSVDAFVEKPDAPTAAAYLEDGRYFWNSGIFVLHAQTFADEVRRLHREMLQACEDALDKAKEDLCFLRVDAEAFARCPSISVDYAVMERTDKTAMLPLDAGWSDVGSWSALRDLGAPDPNGNVKSGPTLLADTKNCFVHAETSLVATLGVENLIVVDTPDALLVAAGDRAEEVGRLAQCIKAAGRNEHAQHRRHHRPWGAFDILNEGPGFKVKLISVKPGGRLSLQMHHHRSEHWVVVSGRAKVTHGARIEFLEENQSSYISAGEWHRLENPGGDLLKIIEVQIGAYLGEDDIERAGDDYNRTPSET